MSKQTLRYLIISLVTIILLITTGFYIPISSKQYAANDVQNIGNDSIEIIHYPLAIEFKLKLVMGVCDKINVSSEGTDVKVITITASSEVKKCTMNLIHKDVQQKVFMLPWQKRFTIRYYDKTLLEDTL